MHLALAFHFIEKKRLKPNMGSKMLVLLALSIAFALLISSEVTARDLSETTPNCKSQLLLLRLCL